MHTRLTVDTLSFVVAVFDRIKNALSRLTFARTSVPRGSHIPFIGGNVGNETVFEDVPALVKAVFENQLEDRAEVIVGGIYSRFSHFYSPRLFSPILPSQSWMPQNRSGTMELETSLEKIPPSKFVLPKGVGVRSIPKINEGKYSRGRLEIRLPHLPVCALPAVHIARGTDTDVVKIGFLYPKDSVGFMALPPLSADGNYYIPQGTKGIPIVIPQGVDLSKYVQSSCQVKAVIRKAPEDILKLFAAIPKRLQRELAESFYRPDSSTTKGFYLEITNAIRPRIEEKRIHEFQGTIFLESHIEGLKFESTDDILQDFILHNMKLLKQDVRNGFSPGIVRINNAQSLGLSRANLLVRAPNEVAVYSKCNLHSPDDYRTSYQFLRDLLEDFQEAMNAFAHECRKRGIPVTKSSIKHDFIFDYECQYDFADDGVLGSDAARRAASLSSELQQTADLASTQREQRRPGFISNL